MKTNPDNKLHVPVNTKGWERHENNNKSNLYLPEYFAVVVAVVVYCLMFLRLRNGLSFYQTFLNESHIIRVSSLVSSNFQFWRFCLLPSFYSTVTLVLHETLKKFFPQSLSEKLVLQKISIILINYTYLTANKQVGTIKLICSMVNIDLYERFRCHMATFGSLLRGVHSVHAHNFSFDLPGGT